MARLPVSDDIKRNLWATPETDSPLEPQRSDLWYVDLTNAQTATEATFGSGLPMLPQFIQSVSLPEMVLKPDAIRRDSVAFNTPSWDEPLGPVKIVFWMDTERAGVSAVYAFLTRWSEMVRAGRGLRSSGYNDSSTNEITLLPLDENFKANYRFDCKLFWLRGSVAQASLRSQGNRAQQNKLVQNFMDQQRAQRNALQGDHQGDQQTVVMPPSVVTAVDIGQAARKNFCDLVIWQEFKLQQMWLAGFKVSDLNYTTTALSTIEATFYVESIDWVTPNES